MHMYTCFLGHPYLESSTIHSCTHLRIYTIPSMYVFFSKDIYTMLRSLILLINSPILLQILHGHLYAFIVCNMKRNTITSKGLILPMPQETTKTFQFFVTRDKIHISVKFSQIWCTIWHNIDPKPGYPLVFSLQFYVLLR